MDGEGAVGVVEAEEVQSLAEEVVDVCTSDVRTGLGLPCLF